MSDQMTIAGRTITVRPLTMRQIRWVMAELKKMSDEAKELPVEERTPAHVLDLLFDDSVPAIAVAESTGLSLAELEGEIGQKEARDLLDRVKAANPFFVGMMERMCGTPVIQSGLSPTQSVA